MSRLVIHDANGPSEIKVQDQSISICRCGLTKNKFGLCDKSHKKTEDEKKETLYVYNDDGTRYTRIAPICKNKCC